MGPKGPDGNIHVHKIYKYRELNYAVSFIMRNYPKYRLRIKMDPGPGSDVSGRKS